MIYKKYEINTKLIRKLNTKKSEKNNPKIRKYPKFRIRISENINLYFIRTKIIRKFSEIFGGNTSLKLK